MSKEGTKDSLCSWIYLGVLVFSVGLIMGMMNSAGVLVVVFVDYYRESNAKAGWISSISWFLNCSCFPVVLYLRRHFRFRFIVVCSSVLIVYAFISTPFMPNFNFVFLTYCTAFGVGAGLFDCLSIITIREYFDKYLGLATGIRFASIGVGVMIYNYVLPILFDAIGWKKTFFALSALLGMACISLSMVYHSPSVDDGKESDDVTTKYQKVENNNSRTPSYAILQNTTFLFLLIGSVPFVFVILSPSTFLMQYAKDLGYPLSKSKWILVVYGLASLLGRLTIAIFGDFLLKKRKVTKVTIAGIVFFGVGSFLCSLTRSLPLIISCAGLIGFFEGMYWVNLPLTNFEVTVGKQTDQAYVLMMLVAGFVLLVGPPVSGWLFDVTGDFRYVLYLVSTCSIIAAIIMAIGTLFTSREYDTSAKMEGNEAALYNFKTNKFDYFKVLGIRTVSPGTQLIPLVEYESTV